MRWSDMTDWRPDRLSRRLPYLQERARLQGALRLWFAREGFVEVETPILQVAPGAEVHLTGFATDWELPDGEDEFGNHGGGGQRHGAADVLGFIFGEVGANFGEKRVVDELDEPDDSGHDPGGGCVQG